MDSTAPFSPISDDDGLLNRDEVIEKLKEEIVELRRRLHLYSSLGCGMGSLHGDGPMASVIYFNTKQSRNRRQAIEASCVGDNYWCTSEGGAGSTAQESSIDLLVVRSSGAVLKAVGAVEYYNGFCVDRLGMPAGIDTEKEFKGDYEPPLYHQNYLTSPWSGAVATKQKKMTSRSRCFNCGGDHVVRDCPLPKNVAVINKNRINFEASTPQFSKSRYHADDDSSSTSERFSQFTPGTISDKLCDALGVIKGDPPPYISRMRQLGYPPGYRQCHHDNHDGVLALYDDTDSHPKDIQKYDKPIQYPGFNCPLQKQGDQRRNHKRRQTEPAMSIRSRPVKVARLTDQRCEVDMDISDGDLEEGEIFSATPTPDRRRSSSSVDTPVVRKRFSLDFPPCVLSSGEDTPTTPHRWNSIKDILDRSKT